MSYRYRFACAIFLNRNGYPPDHDWFPSEKQVAAWKVLYCIKSAKGFELWYLHLWKKYHKKWKAIRDKPFHIPKEESLIPSRVDVE